MEAGGDASFSVGPLLDSQLILENNELLVFLEDEPVEDRLGT